MRKLRFFGTCGYASFSESKQNLLYSFHIKNIILTFYGLLCVLMWCKTFMNYAKALHRRLWQLEALHSNSHKPKICHQYYHDLFLSHCQSILCVLLTTVQVILIACVWFHLTHQYNKIFSDCADLHFYMCILTRHAKKFRHLVLLTTFCLVQ